MFLSFIEFLLPSELVSSESLIQHPTPNSQGLKKFKDIKSSEHTIDAAVHTSLIE